MLEFSADSKTVVFSTFPAKAEIDKARKDKKPAPKDGMVIVDLASGKATRIERVKRFAMPEKAVGPAGVSEGRSGRSGRCGADARRQLRRRARAISRVAAAGVAARRRCRRPRPAAGVRHGPGGPQPGRCRRAHRHRRG